MQTNTEENKVARSEAYTEEFKRSVITHWLESGKAAVKVAAEFGVKPWNLRDWRHKFAPAAKAPTDAIAETPEAMRCEIRRLRQELARVTSQREILKKTLGIVSEV
jgi:transposase-like protein